MKTNMGKIDKIVRIVLAILIFVLYLLDVISGTLGLVLLMLSGIFVLTSVFGFCPLYLPFNINTKEKKEHSN